MLTTFHNVAITVDAASPAAAKRALDRMLRQADAVTLDTYNTDEQADHGLPDGPLRSASELYASTPH